MAKSSKYKLLLKFFRRIRQKWLEKGPSHGARPTLKNEAVVAAMPGVVKVVPFDSGTANWRTSQSRSPHFYASFLG